MPSKDDAQIGPRVRLVTAQHRFESVLFRMLGLQKICVMADVSTIRGCARLEARYINPGS
jgi:acid phosphatase family membrane protein YuiD